MVARTEKVGEIVSQAYMRMNKLFYLHSRELEVDDTALSCIDVVGYELVDAARCRRGTANLHLDGLLNRIR